MKKCSIFILVLSLFGCGGSHTFVTQRDVPRNPAFVVIPATTSLYQLDFANEVESALIGAGVSVKARPSVKAVSEERELEKSAVQSDRSSAEGQKAEATLIEAYMTYGEIEADYIVQTYADGDQVRIIKGQGDEVIASFQIKEVMSAQEVNSTNKTIREALNALGFDVKEER